MTAVLIHVIWLRSSGSTELGCSLAALPTLQSPPPRGIALISFAPSVDSFAPTPSWLQPIVAERGSGSYVWTTDGRKHLDFACGIGPCCFLLLLPPLTSVLHT